MGKPAKYNKPPRSAVWLLKRFFPDEKGIYTQLGDMEEAFNKIARDKNKFAAQTWYWLNTTRSIPFAIVRSVKWNTSMLKNYMKTAGRNLLKQKTGSFINILGLSIGLAFCILIFLFIRDELSFDRFHKNADSIYSIIANNHFQERSHRHIPVPMAPALKIYFPEIEDYARIVDKRNIAVRHNENIFDEIVSLIDPHFLEVFSFPLIKGNPHSVLNSGNSVVLTQGAAHKYFGNEDPIGKVLLFTFGEKQKPFEVTGIAENVLPNSTIRFSILIHIDNLSITDSSNAAEDWTRFSSESYFLLKKGTNPEYIENSMLDLVKPQLAGFYELMQKWDQLVKDGETVTFSLQNLKEMHLNSPNIFGAPRSDIKRSHILAGIALLILFIAVINFINMSIGRASMRAQEVGVRKILGAERKQLIRQFWIESVLTSSTATVLGLLTVALMLPVFNSLAGKNLTWHSLYNFKNIVVFLTLMVSVGVLAGSFPALVMANFKIKDTLVGKLKLSRNSFFTKILIILQFSLSIFLLVSSLSMSRQISFMRSYDLGFDKEGVVVVDLQERHTIKSQELLKLYLEHIQLYPAVRNVSGCMNSPNRTFLYGVIEREGKNVNVYFNKVYYDYIDTMQMNLIAGRDFSSQFLSAASSVIVNKKLTDELGLDQPLGKKLTMGPEPPLTIIGVVDNFNYSSLAEEAGPAALNMDPTLGLFYALVNISPENISDTITFLRNKWKEIQPDRPFKYSFLDDDIKSFYTDENRWRAIVSYSSFFTVLIACMGVFGLTLITINNRAKEMSIRKVLGASLFNVLKLIAREFVFLVMTANIIAWPVTWLIMHTWLNGFVYKTDLSISIFLSGGLLVLLSAMLTVSFPAIRLSLSNPVDSLRSE